MTSEDKKPNKKWKKWSLERIGTRKKAEKAIFQQKNGAIKEWILVLNRAHHGSNQPRLGLFRDKHFFLLRPDLIEIISACKVQVDCMNDQTCKNLESTS